MQDLGAAIIRTLIITGLGLVLFLVNAWFVRLVYSTIRSPEFVIAPISIVGDQSAEGSGTALAQLLQARLKTLEYELAETESALRNASEQPDSVVAVPKKTAAGAETSIVPVFRFSTVRMPTALLSAPDINVSVAGVEVGGVLPFLERLFARRRQLTFTISPGRDGGLVAAGDIQPLVTRGPAQIWLETKGPYAEALNDLALAILQKRLGEDPSNRIDSLTAEEFKMLVTAVVTTADLNRRAESGRTPEHLEFMKLLESVKPLTEKVPDWLELTYFVAVIADRADAHDDAIGLYEVVQQAAKRSDLSAEMSALIASGQIEERVAALTILRDFVGQEVQLAKASPAVNVARQRILADMQFATERYRELFDLDLPIPNLVLLEKYDNAFWSAEKNAYVTPVAAQYTPDVTYHDVAHPFIAKFIGLDWETTDAAAMTESYCDVLSAWVRQTKLGQSAADAEWEMGVGVPAWLTGGDPVKDRRALRSLKTGESLYPARTRLQKYSRAAADAAGAHVLAGMPNHAFYGVATKLGTDAAARIWRDALKALGPQSRIPDLAAATVKAAERTSGTTGAAAAKEAWRIAGVG